MKQNRWMRGKFAAIAAVAAALAVASCGEKAPIGLASAGSTAGGTDAGDAAAGDADGDPDAADSGWSDAAPDDTGPADNAAPTIAFKNVSNGSKVSGTFAVEVDTADDIGVTAVEYRLNGTPVYTASQAPFGWYWDTTAFANGKWYLSAVARDAEGKSSEPAEVEVSVSNEAVACGEAPQVKLVYPADKAVVCGELAIHAAASGPCGMAKVEFFVDEQKIGEASQPPYKAQWKTADLKDGQHAVKVVAVDAAKQSSQQTIVIKVDNQQSPCVNPPAVFLGKPADNSYVFGKVEIEAEAGAGGDMAAIVEVLFSIDGSSIGKASTSPWAVSWDSDAKAEGAHTLKAIAKDNFDKLGVHQITLTVDRTDPTVSFVAPAESTNLNGDAAPAIVTADAADNFALVGVSFAAQGPSGSALDLGSAKQKPWQVQWSTAGKPSGQWTLTATAKDAAGRTGKTARTVMLDRDPTVSWSSGWQTGKPLAGVVKIHGEAQDDLGIPSAVKVTIDGKDVAAVSNGQSSKSFSYGWDTAQAGYGEHELVAEVADSGGHKAVASLKVQTDQPLAMSANVCAVDWQGCKAPAVDPSTEYTGKVYLQVAAKDDNAEVKKVELQVDGATVQTGSAAPWQFAWDSAGVKDGKHELAVKVTTSLPESKSAAFGLTVNNCDLDHDKHLAQGGACGGDDCDDKADKVYAGAADSVGNGTDDNCDGIDGVDADGDKVASLASGGKDCNDANKAAYPCADELPGSAVDANCDGKLAVSCDDCVGCTSDALVNGKCAHVAIGEGAGCEDGNVCTGGEVCKGGVCGAGVVKNCDDANVCTADACDVAKGCLHAAVGDGGACDLDASKCTPDVCKAGNCAKGIALDCDDKNACTADSCDAVTGKCGNAAKANGAACDDGDACTLNDACAVGACKGAAKVCGAGEVCAGGVCKAGAPAGMVLIPAGSFKMGCVPAGDASCSAGEKPQHSVTLSAYYIDKTEVTVAAYKKCVDAGKCSLPSCNPSDYKTYGVNGKEQHPVNCVTWSQADAYCKWTDPKGRLPTESEWEKAARGGLDGKVYPWGDQSPACTPGQPYTVVWGGAGNGCGKNSTWAVGTGSSPNGYGLYDMSGNVWEWVNDWYSSSYYDSSPATDPKGPVSGPNRVFRGGSFVNFADSLRASQRAYFSPGLVVGFLGFRCAKSLP